MNRKLNKVTNSVSLSFDSKSYPASIIFLLNTPMKININNVTLKVIATIQAILRKLEKFFIK